MIAIAKASIIQLWVAVAKLTAVVSLFTVGIVTVRQIIMEIESFFAVPGDLALRSNQICILQDLILKLSRQV